MIKTIKLKGGNISDSKFDAKELKRGTDKEFEHTDDKNIAKQIAKVHLMEHKDYYKVLELAEEKMH